MQYERVLPRDLFNEAKLLKCLGQLCLKIHDGLCDWKWEYNTQYTLGFNIQQDPSDGSIFVSNLMFRTKRDVIVSVKTSLNSLLPYPMVFMWEGAEYPLFDDSGEFTEEYREFGC